MEVNTNQAHVCPLLKYSEGTTSNIGASIISLHDTPRLHTLKHVVRIFSFGAHIMKLVSLL